MKRARRLASCRRGWRVSNIPLKWLVSKLIDSGCGRMALVVCGGPSIFSDLKRIPNREKAIIISANHHAFKTKLQPDYIWCKDHLRITPGYLAQGRKRQRMEPELRRYGVPIVGPNFWCDYRAIEWPLQQFNSGQQALAFAVLLGCAPIIPIGMDCFNGATYFHDADAPNISNGRRPGFWNSRIQKLKANLPGAPIRGVSGLVETHFGRYKPDQPLVPGDIPHPLAKYVKMDTVWLRMRKEIQDARDRFAIIPKGYIMASNKDEAGRFVKQGVAERVQLFDA